MNRMLFRFCPFSSKACFELGCPFAACINFSFPALAFHCLHFASLAYILRYCSSTAANRSATTARYAYRNGDATLLLAP